MSIVVVAGTLVPRASEACDPVAFPTEAFPASGSVLPRNAGVRFTGDEIYQGLPGVTVDGLPTPLFEIVELGGFEGPKNNWTNFSKRVRVGRIDPKPPIGASIAFPLLDPPVEYVAGPADVTPPAPLAGLSIGLHDLAPEGCMSDCGPVTALNYWIAVEGGGQDEGSPVVHRVFFNDTGDGTDGEPIASFMAGAQTQVRLRRTPEWVQEHDPLDVCVTVRTFDTAMNEAQVARRICKVCRARIETARPGEVCTEWTVGEPAWTPEDVLPGGSCVAMEIPPLPAPEPEPDTTTGEEPGESSTGTPVDETTGTSGASSTGAPGESSTGALAGSSTGPASSTGATEEPTTGAGGPTSATGGSTSAGSTGPATAGEDEPGEKGCACASETSAGTPAWALVLLAWRRRRSAR